MQVSDDGCTLVLLLSTRDTYVVVINLRTNKIVHKLQVSGCHAMHLSPACDYICTSSMHEAVRVVRIYQKQDCYVALGDSYTPPVSLSRHHCIHSPHTFDKVSPPESCQITALVDK